MTKRQYQNLDHEPVCDDYYTRFKDFAEWLDAQLIYTEEVGLARGYFFADSPYMETYRRPLTARQAAMRKAYAPLAWEEHQAEEEQGLEVDEDADFGLT